MAIRTATLPDEDQIRRVHLAAFRGDEEELVATLASALLHDASNPEILHLVAEDGGRIIGHVAFSPVRSSSGGGVVGSLLSPLGVDPSRQKKGVGSRLVREGLVLLATGGVRMAFVYGDPNYYGRFGFTSDLAEGFAPPFELKHPHGWQAACLAGRRPAATAGALEFVSALNNPALW